MFSVRLHRNVRMLALVDCTQTWHARLSPLIEQAIALVARFSEALRRSEAHRAAPCPTRELGAEVVQRLRLRCEDPDQQLVW